MYLVQARSVLAQDEAPHENPYVGLLLLSTVSPFYLI